MTTINEITAYTMDSAPMDGTPVILFGVFAYDGLGPLELDCVIASYCEKEGDLDWHILGYDYYPARLANPQGWFPAPQLKDVVAKDQCDLVAGIARGDCFGLECAKAGECLLAKYHKQSFKKIPTITIQETTDKVNE